MTVWRRYLLGVSAVAAAALLLSFVVPPDARAGLWVATLLALIVQAPLGWWLVRALGTERFHLIWAIGIAARFALFAAAGFVVAPRFGLALAPLLFALWGVLMCCMVVEAVVLSRVARIGAALVVLLALVGGRVQAQEHAPAAHSNEINIMEHL